jgi:ankyrin repeat protein
MSRHSRVVLASVVAAAALACTGPVPVITPLARAAREGNAQTIAAMVAAGQDPNGVDPGGNHWTPLLHAIHKGRRPAIDALLATGADVHKKSGLLSPLMMAVGNGQADIVRRLLAVGADPRADGPGIFPTAVAGGALTDIENPLLGRCNADVVKALLDRDPSLRLPRNARGHLSLLFARLNNCEEVLRLARLG